MTRRQNNPPIVVTGRNEVARRDTKRRQGTNDGCAVVVIDDATEVLRQLPTGKAVFDKGAQDASRCEVLEKSVGSIASSGGKARRFLDHHTKKRTGKRLDQCLVVYRDSVAGQLQFGMGDEMTDTFVGVMV